MYVVFIRSVKQAESIFSCSQQCEPGISLDCSGFIYAHLVKHVMFNQDVLTEGCQCEVVDWDNVLHLERCWCHLSVRDEATAVIKM